MAVNTQVARALSASRQYPLALLWSYEFRRQNDILSTRLLGIKDQLKGRGQLNELLSKVLNDLIVIISSMLTILANVSDGGEHRLRHLRGLLAQTLAPLYDHEARSKLGNDALTSCIAQLEMLHNLPGVFSSTDASEPAPSLSSSLSSASDSPPGSPSWGSQDETRHDISCASPSIICGPDKRQLSAAEARAALAMKLDVVMHQNGRPLQEYFDEACAFRRYQIRLRQADDAKLIQGFLAGLDNNLFRKRLTRALKKGGWYWTWLTHEVLYILIEQEYMDRDDHGSEHITTNEAFFRPDGTCKYRVVALPPVTEEDLAG